MDTDTLFCKELTTIIINYHQRIFGRGPSKVKIYGSNGQYSITITGILNKYEEFIMDNVNNGELEIKRLRKKALKTMKEPFINLIEHQFKVKVLGLTFDLDVKLELMYGVLIIKEQKSNKEN